MASVALRRALAAPAASPAAATPAGPAAAPAAAAAAGAGGSGTGSRACGAAGRGGRGGVPDSGAWCLRRRPAAAAWRAEPGRDQAGLLDGARAARAACRAAQRADRDGAAERGLEEAAAAGRVGDLPVVQVNNRIRTGSASRDRSTIANPTRMVRVSLPVPIRVNAVA